MTAETTTNREQSSIPVTILASRPPASGTPPTMSSCHNCIGASRCHRLYFRPCRCSCGLTRPLRASTRCTVARPGTALIPRWPSSKLIRRAPHRGCSRRSWQITASTTALSRDGLVFGRLDLSARPGMPSASNRLRHECSDCRVVP
jgi:hypothetical protein